MFLWFIDVHYIAIICDGYLQKPYNLCEDSLAIHLASYPMKILNADGWGTHCMVTLCDMLTSDGGVTIGFFP